MSEKMSPVVKRVRAYFAPVVRGVGTYEGPTHLRCGAEWRVCVGESASSVGEFGVDRWVCEEVWDEGGGTAIGRSGDDADAGEDRD